MGWIDAKNSLPKTGMTVLVYTNLGSMYIARFYGRLTNRDDIDFGWEVIGSFQNMSELLFDSVTHWMLLPKSPKEKV